MSATPQELHFAGSTLIGSDGATDRTYVITEATDSILEEGIQIFVNGVHLHQGTGLDFTLSGGVNAKTTTFLNATWDTQYFDIFYFTTTPVSSPTTALCTDGDVRAILGLSPNNDDLGSDDIGSIILDSQGELYAEFGNPLKKTHTLISNLGSKYWVKQNREQIYRLDRVEVAGSLVSTGSYTSSLNDGTIVLDSTFNTNEYGEIMEFEYTPKVFNLLCKNMAALLLLENYTTSDGPDITNSNIGRI